MSKDEAMSVVLWRAYDCGINGIADACFQQRSQLDGAEVIIEKPTNEKIAFLLEHHLFPLPPHQAYGTVMARV